MSLLTEFLAQQSPRPVDWRSSHCCAVPAVWVGFAERRVIELPAVADARDALAVVLRRGGIVGAVSAIIGREPVAVSLASPGDIVAYPPGVVGDGRIGSVGIVLEHLEPPVAIVFGGLQATLHPVSAATAAWEIARGMDLEIHR